MRRSGIDATGPTAEWGAANSMVMTEACEHAAGVHDRMPAILPRSNWGDWLDGPPDAVGLLCRPYELGMRVERTGGGLGAEVSCRAQVSALRSRREPARRASERLPAGREA